MGAVLYKVHESIIWHLALHPIVFLVYILAARAAPQGLKQQVPGPWAQEALHTGRQWRGAAPASTVGAVASPRVRPPTEEGAMRGRGRGPASRGRGGGHSKARLATGAGLLEWGGRGPAHIPSWPLRCPWPGRL